MNIRKEDFEFIEENIPYGENIVESGDTAELVRALTEWVTFYGFGMNGQASEDAEYALDIIDRLRNDNCEDFQDEEENEPPVSDIPEGMREMYGKW